MELVPRILFITRSTTFYKPIPSEMHIEMPPILRGAANQVGLTPPGTTCPVCLGGCFWIKKGGTTSGVAVASVVLHSDFGGHEAWYMNIHETTKSTSNSILDSRKNAINIALVPSEGFGKTSCFFPSHPSHWNHGTMGISPFFEPLPEDRSPWDPSQQTMASSEPWDRTTAGTKSIQFVFGCSRTWSLKMMVEICHRLKVNWGWSTVNQHGNVNHGQKQHLQVFDWKSSGKKKTPTVGENVLAPRHFIENLESQRGSEISIV